VRLNFVMAFLIATLLGRAIAMPKQQSPGSCNHLTSIRDLLFFTCDPSSTVMFYPHPC
jgi:hypothetical protein